MKKLKLFLCGFLGICSIAFGQKTQIDGYILLNQVDRLLVEKDTLMALRLYETIDTENCTIKSGRYRKLSRIYYQFGEIEKSKQQMKKAVENGLWGAYYFLDEPEEVESIAKGIKDKYGADFLQELQTINQQKIKEALATRGNMIHELWHIYEMDQKWRKIKRYKQCRSYEFGYRLDFPNDSTLNHEEMMACFEEFRYNDSILLQRFVDIVDSLGFVPGDDMLFGMIPIRPVVNHTAHFDYKNLDSLYLKSVKLGTITPELYAWYQGYHEEYFKKEHQFYFTHGEVRFNDFSKEKIDEINQRRLEIGLPSCPAVVWNTKMY